MDTSDLFAQTENCFGCSACKSICPVNAISLKSDSEGFLYPHIDEKICINCRSCIKVCPQKKRKTIKQEQTPISDGIGIINLQVTDNYGANLLAFALETKVSQLFNDREVFTINASVPEKPKTFEEKITKKADSVLNKIKKYKFKLLPMYISEKRNKKANEAYRAEKKSAFNEFRKEYLNLTAPCYSSDDISKLPVDTVILGSDIVWSPERASTHAADVFFAAGLGSKYKRISYAASIGCNDKNILTPLEGVYRENLKDIESISIREQSTAEYLKKLTDKKVDVCCDPVFLLEKSVWNEMADSVRLPDEKYIYVYLLDRCSDGVKAAKKLAREKGLKILYSTNNNISFGKNSKCCNGCGPCEFLNIIKNADYIITNSFHSLVFSIIFHKQFKVYFRKGQNLKLTDLLDKLCMQNRYDCKTDIDSPIDFDFSDKFIEKEVLHSIEFLKSAIDKEQI